MCGTGDDVAGNAKEKTKIYVSHVKTDRKSSVVSLTTV